MIDLGTKIIRYDAPGDVSITRETGTSYQYVDGTDYIIESNDGLPTGEITGLHPDLTVPNDGSGPPQGWVSVLIRYDRKKDVTQHIIDIVGQRVYLNIPHAGMPDVGIVFKYRHKVSEVLKPSIKAKTAFGTSIIATPYIEGIDYTFDPLNSTIQRLSTGTIPSSSDIYVDYKYNDINDQLEQFFVWAKASVIEGIDIITEIKTAESSLALVGTLEPDTELGEDFLASIAGVGLVSLASLVRWPRLSGYTQFVVKSKNPEENDHALIRQVLMLKDGDGDFIFIQGGKYFEELTAIREPMTQVSYPFLKTNVLLNDSSQFAVRELLLGNVVSYQIMVNFRPNSSDYLYSFVPSNSTATTEAPGLEPFEEEWRLEWVKKSINATSFKQVRVKCELERSTEVNGNITPKVEHLFIKAGY
jgi:hypothetical protein